jgi:hypothetical protein
MEGTLCEPGHGASGWRRVWWLGGSGGTPEESEGLDRFTEEVQVPPGVTGKARTHLRRKKMAVRAALAGGAAAVTAGRGRRKTFWGKSPQAEGRGPVRIDATLYVSPKTYLPVLVIWNNRAHYRDGRPLDGTVRQEITALPRTARNIAKAHVTVPAGFRQVPDGTFGGPVSGWFNSG